MLNTNEMSPELFWLSLTALMTALFWVPYILNRFIEMGILPAIMNPNADPTPQAAWAKRMMHAHRNAIENLAVFAPLALAVHLSGSGSELTNMAVAIYFFARLAHFIIFSCGIPALRTITFLIGFACQVILALSIFGA